MKVRTQILLSFFILGLIIISSSILGVFRIKHQLEEIGHFHTNALYSIQSLNSKLTEAVEESFAYVVSGEMAEKVEFMHWADNFQQEAQKFSTLAGLDRPGKKKNARYITRSSLITLFWSNRPKTCLPNLKPPGPYHGKLL